MITLKRFPDWPQRLRRAIEERRDRPHAWGANDCAIFAADLVAAMTGVDFAIAFRGLYDDEAGAKALLEAHGWQDLAGLADHCLPRQAARPRRGDLVLQDGRHGPYLGIAWQGGVISAGPRRPLLWPMKGVIACWAVG